MEPASANVTTTTLRLERKADPPNDTGIFYRQPWQKMGQEKGNKAADERGVTAAEWPKAGFNADSVNQSLTIWVPPQGCYHA